MFTKDGILTLIETLIADPTRTNLLLDLAQLKDLPPWMQLKPRKGVITTDTPLIIAIKLFVCLYKHVNVFLHGYVNVVWSLKGPEGLNLSILIIFFLQKISITLQRM
jgi:hypothetical protein